MTRLISAIGGVHQGVAVAPHQHRQAFAFAPLFGPTKGLGARTVPRIPLERRPGSYPLRVSRAKLIEAGAQGFEGEFETVKGAHGREDMRRIGPLLPSCFDPPAGFADLQKGIEELMRAFMVD